MRPTPATWRIDRVATLYMPSMNTTLRSVGSHASAGAIEVTLETASSPRSRPATRERLSGPPLHGRGYWLLEIEELVVRNRPAKQAAGSLRAS